MAINEHQGILEVNSPPRLDAIVRSQFAMHARKMLTFVFKARRKDTISFIRQNLRKHKTLEKKEKDSRADAQVFEVRASPDKDIRRAGRHLHPSSRRIQLTSAFLPAQKRNQNKKRTNAVSHNRAGAIVRAVCSIECGKRGLQIRFPKP